MRFYLPRASGRYHPLPDSVAMTTDDAHVNVPFQKNRLDKVLLEVERFRRTHSTPPAAVAVDPLTYLHVLAHKAAIENRCLPDLVSIALDHDNGAASFYGTPVYASGSLALHSSVPTVHVLGGAGAIVQFLKESR